MNTNNTRKINVRLIPDLCAAAFREKKTYELALYYMLRYLNRRDNYGSGASPLEFIIKGLEDVFLLKRSTIYRKLISGEGDFWRRTTHNGKVTIHIIGLARVCEYLGTTIEYTRRFREIPPSEFTGPISNIRAQLYASIFKPHGQRANPISRESITRTTRLSPVQQRRYDKRAKIRRTYNQGVEYNRHTGKTSILMMYVYSKNKRYRVPRRLGNIYHSRQQDSKKGMLPTVHTALKNRESLETAGAAHISERIYFDSHKKAKRYATRTGKETRYLVNNQDRLVKGRLEWSEY